MIGSTRNLRVLAYPAPVDLRKGYNGLSGLVLLSMSVEPVSEPEPPSGLVPASGVVVVPLLPALSLDEHA